VATKRKRKKITAKKVQKGAIGNFFVYGVLALLLVLGITAVGGLPERSTPQNGTIVTVVTPTLDPNHNSLQLKTFGYVVPTNLCQSEINNEPEILIGYLPSSGQSVTNTGQIKVWVNDERAPLIAPNEKVDTTQDGHIITPGNRTAQAHDRYLFEPAIYISPDTAESGESAHFPDFIKGQFNNAGKVPGNIIKGVAIDPIPPGSKKAGGPNPNGSNPNVYLAEYVWNVSSLGLTTGTYQVEFLIHDGDIDRGIGCVGITIQ